MQSLIFEKSCLQVKQQFNLIEYLLICNLLLGLIPNTWRGAINNNEIVASVYMCKDDSSNKVTCHQVVSSIHTGAISNYFIFFMLFFFNILYFYICYLFLIIYCYFILFYFILIILLCFTSCTYNTSFSDSTSSISHYKYLNKQ
jgi:hypothetical protein